MKFPIHFVQLHLHQLTFKNILDKYELPVNVWNYQCLEWSNTKNAILDCSLGQQLRHAHQFLKGKEVSDKKVKYVHPRVKVC